MERTYTLLYWKSPLQEILLVRFLKYLGSTSSEGPILPPDSSSYSKLDCKKCDNGLARLEQPHSVCLKTAIFRTASVTKTGPFDPCFTAMAPAGIKLDRNAKGRAIPHDLKTAVVHTMMSGARTPGIQLCRRLRANAPLPCITPIFLASMVTRYPRIGTRHVRLRYV
jgi:hypothetical protein